MVGKIKRVRQKLHQGAVKINYTSLNLEKAPVFPLNVTLNRSLPRQESYIKTSDNTKDVKTFNFPKGIFAGTKITPETLVQTLNFDEPSSGQTTAQPVQHKGGGERKQLSKKEKLKDRRARWLSKISAIKLAREQQVAQVRRKATPVVGDMKPLADALPELSELLPSIRAPTHRKQRGVVKKKAEPTDYCQMKPAHKRKLLEMEASRFSETLKDPAFKANPLLAIGEHLRKRLRQEEEQS